MKGWFSLQQTKIMDQYINTFINFIYGAFTISEALDEEICLLNILLDFSPNNLFVIRLCTIVN